MNVIFMNGKKGQLGDEQAKELYVQGRYAKDEWEALKQKMEALQIREFEDEFLKQLQGFPVTIPYVDAQICVRA